MPVPGMAVIKCARTLCRVAAEQELIIAAGQRAQYRLHNRIGNTEASSTMNSILSSWNPCMFSGFVAVLAVANHRFSFLPCKYTRLVHFRIFRNSGERLIHLSEFTPQYVAGAAAWSALVATTSGVRETRQEPKQRCRLKPCLSYARPDFMLTFGLPAKSISASRCHPSGSNFSTSTANSAGSFPQYGILCLKNPFSAASFYLPEHPATFHLPHGITSKTFPTQPQSNPLLPHSLSRCICCLNFQGHQSSPSVPRSPSPVLMQHLVILLNHAAQL